MNKTSPLPFATKIQVLYYIPYDPTINNYRDSIFLHSITVQLHRIFTFAFVFIYVICVITIQLTYSSNNNHHFFQVVQYCRHPVDEIGIEIFVYATSNQPLFLYFTVLAIHDLISSSILFISTLGVYQILSMFPVNNCRTRNENKALYYVDSINNRGTYFIGHIMLNAKLTSVTCLIILKTIYNSRSAKNQIVIGCHIDNIGLYF